MKVFKRIKWAYVLVSVFFIVIGVLLILNPETSMTMLCRVLGIGAIVFGILRVIGYFLRELDGVALRYDFASGVFAVIAGAMVIWRAAEVANIMAVVIGLFILVDCVFKLQVALDSKRMGASSWWVTLLFTCICMVLGCLLIFDTFKGQKIISIMMGVSLVADGLQNLCTVIYAAIFVREAKTAVQNAVDEMTAIETTGEVVTEEAPDVVFTEPEAPAAEPAPPEPQSAAEPPAEPPQLP